MGITCYMVRPTAHFMYWHWSTMARFPHRWQFGHPSTSDLDQGQGGICRPDCIGRRQKLHSGRRVLSWGNELGLATASGLLGFPEREMSAVGTQQTSMPTMSVSASGGKADIPDTLTNVR
jgi:hypothetical protein